MDPIIDKFSQEAEASITAVSEQSTLVLDYGQAKSRALAESDPFQIYWKDKRSVLQRYANLKAKGATAPEA